MFYGRMNPIKNSTKTLMRVGQRKMEKLFMGVKIMQK
jgi:hypothetical protein